MKILPNGIAVVDGDTHISKWVEEHGTLAIAEDMLKPFEKYVPRGSTVIDAGANIGDHTVTYSKWVGSDGWVMAFEPNPIAYECLLHNTERLDNVVPITAGLSDKTSTVSVASDANVGASYLVEDGTEINTSPLDFYEFKKVSFIKIDVEGYEARVLKGARVTIAKYRPVMLIEVNCSALHRAGSSVTELFNLLHEMDYMLVASDPRIDWSAPQYDILCRPIERTYQT